MAFKFNWPEFSKEFIEQARQLLNTALNKSNKPANIVDHIVVKELNMGTQAPELEILEIGELALDKFRGIFKLTYSGDAYLVLQTKVQANPMNNNKLDSATYTRRGILAADQPLVVPMLLTLSNLKLRGIVVLVVSKQKGVTLVFKNDPLEKVDVTSTFDSVSSVQRFLQTEIEKRLRIMFQEDLPSIVHQLSLQKWLNEEKKNNETPVLKPTSDRGPVFDRSPLQYLSENTPYDTVSMPELRYNSPLSTPNSDLSLNTSPDSSFYAEDGYSMIGGDLDSLDGLSAYSNYSNFGELFDKEKGLKVISKPKEIQATDSGNQPRVFHRQRLMGTRRGSLPTWLPSNHKQQQQQQAQKPLRRHMYTTSEVKKNLPPILTRDILGEIPTSTSPTSLDNSPTPPMTTANLQRHNQYQYIRLETLSTSHPTTFSPSGDRQVTPQPLPHDNGFKNNNASQDVSENRTVKPRLTNGGKNNNSDSFLSSDEGHYFNASSPHDYIHDPEQQHKKQQEFVLQPSETSVAAQLATLMNSNHTISPYTRTLQHLTFRSYPHPINQKLGNKRAKPGGKIQMKRNVLKFPGLTTGFGHCNNSESNLPIAEECTE